MSLSRPTLTTPSSRNFDARAVLLPAGLQHDGYQVLGAQHARRRALEFNFDCLFDCFGYERIIGRKKLHRPAFDVHRLAPRLITRARERYS